MKPETIQIKDDSGKLCTVGWIYNKTFYKRVKKSKHFFRKSNSWGVDAEVFNKVIYTDCDAVKILDEEENTLYECTVADFKKYGTYLHIKPNRAQIFMTVFNFNKTFNYHKK